MWSGTDAPVATVLENTLGGTLVWTRTGVGVYEATLAGAFVENKTIGFTQWDRDDNPSLRIGLNIKYSRSENSFIVLINDDVTGDAVDDNLDISIEIRVYN